MLEVGGELFGKGVGSGFGFGEGFVDKGDRLVWRNWRGFVGEGFVGEGFDYGEEF